MNNQPANQVFLSHNDDDLDIVEALATRLQGDARLSFWFGPWHSIPGELLQEQMEVALELSQACAILISDAECLEGWQTEQMRAAIQLRIEDDSSYRIIPVLLPGTGSVSARKLPRFLRRYQPVIFRELDDERAFKSLVAGILGIRPVEVDGFIETAKSSLQAVPSTHFEQGHALIVGVADYADARITNLPEEVRNDARSLHTVLTDPVRCGYDADKVTLLLDDAATSDGIRTALAALAEQTGPNDTAVVYFSGHGAPQP